MRRFVVAMLCGLLLAACASLSWQKPDVRIADIRPGDHATLFEQEFELTLRVTNPNQRALRAQGLRFTVKTDGKDFASGVSNQAIEIPALGSGTVTLKLHTTLAGWVRQLGKVLHDNGQLDYRIDGTLLGAGGLADLPFSSSGSWQLPARGNTPL